MNDIEFHYPYKPGDVIWQQRMPGGACILLEIHEVQETMPPDKEGIVWGDHDFPVFIVWHPTEGRIADPSYYYCAIGDVSSFKERMKEDAIRFEEAVKAVGDIKI